MFLFSHFLTKEDAEMVTIQIVNHEHTFFFFTRLAASLKQKTELLHDADMGQEADKRPTATWCDLPNFFHNIWVHWAHLCDRFHCFGQVTSNMIVVF